MKKTKKKKSSEGKKEKRTRKIGGR